MSAVPFEGTPCCCLFVCVLLCVPWVLVFFVFFFFVLFGSLAQALCERGAEEAEDSDWMWGGLGFRV